MKREGTASALSGRWFTFLRRTDLRHVPPKSGLHYRPDIDGMRAVAVVAVLLFHGNFPGFSGGFVGVDIFFVISGFLIGGIVIHQSDAGAFSLVSFYDRRVRRILPPLFTVIAATLGMGWFLLLPDHFERLGYEVLTTAAFVSNIWFWRQVGYFHPEAHTQPLLHTWSLGIEEQFYLFFPALVLGTIAISRRLLVPIIGAIAAISLAASSLSAFYYPSADFFLLPTRAWELLLGVLLAAEAVPPPQNWKAAEAAGIAGLALMLGPCFLFTEATPFPGATALVPTLGAALTIWAGIAGSAVSRLLSVRPIVFVGLLSYSLYLWHWPIFVALEHYYVRLPLTPGLATAGIALSFLLSFASVRLIEAPVRNRQITRPQVLYPALLAGLAIIATGALYAIRSHGAPERFDARTRQLAAGAEDFEPRYDACLSMPLAQVPSLCRLGGAGPPTFVLWGDSHAAAIAPAIDRIARNQGRSGLLLAGFGCYPTFDFAPPEEMPSDRAKCRHKSDDAAELIRTNPQIATVILTSRWHRKTDPGLKVIAALQHTTERLRASGLRVIVLAGLPAPRLDIPWALATASAHNRRPGSLLLPSGESDFYKFLQALDAAGQITYINLAPALCHGEECDSEREGHATFRDDNHISGFAAKRILAPYLEQRLQLGSPPERSDSHVGEVVTH